MWELQVSFLIWWTDPLYLEHEQGTGLAKTEEWGYVHPPHGGVPQWHVVRCPIRHSEMSTVPLGQEPMKSKLWLAKEQVNVALLVRATKSHPKDIMKCHCSLGLPKPQIQRNDSERTFIIVLGSRETIWLETTYSRIRSTAVLGWRDG